MPAIYHATSACYIIQYFFICIFSKFVRGPFSHQILTELLNTGNYTQLWGFKYEKNITQDIRKPQDINFLIHSINYLLKQLEAWIWSPKNVYVFCLPGIMNPGIEKLLP